MKMYKTLKMATVFAFILISLTPAASAEELVIGLGNFEPHFVKEGNTGLFTDLVKETFALLPQYQLKFRHGRSVKRLIKELNSGRIDAAANVFGSDLKGYVSEPLFRFTDVAVTLKSRNLVIRQVSDLKGKSLITYQGAKIVLGREFVETAETCSRYMEVPEPMTQAKMVAMGRYDVSVGDIYVFLHSLRVWSGGKYKPDQFEFHRIFPDIYTQMGFKDKRVCDDFNRALREIKKNGKYEALYERYLRELGYLANNSK
ncbi:ABC transporter substrate-binding protein [Desulfobacterales bacterium HSG2]|nr:ABC transporter substrate-binding protein [Desulfobacterales bacterium HSG2]